MWFFGGLNSKTIESLYFKDLGACELFPQRILHNNNGRFVALCGDGEYVVYTAQVLRNKCFGTAIDFVWAANGTGDFGICESASRVCCYRIFFFSLLLQFSHM